MLRSHIQGNRELRVVSLRLGLIVAFAALAAACVHRPAPIEFDPNAAQNATPDGLYPVRDRRLSNTFVRPGARFDVYDSVVIEAATLTYRSPPRDANPYNWRRGNFELGPQLTERMKQIFRDSILHAIEGQHVYASSIHLGTGKLRLVPHIADLIYNVPPRVGHQYNSIVLRSGEMTLALEVFDAETGERLALFAQRSAIQPDSSAMRGYDASSVNTWTGVRDVCDAWTRDLVVELLSLREYSPVPDAQ